MRRTLAEELAELASTGPAPDIDPEEVDFGSVPGSLDYHEDNDDTGDQEMPARRMRGDMSNMGREYSGQQTSVSAAFGNGKSYSEETSSDASEADTAESSTDDEGPPNALEQPDEEDSDSGSDDKGGSRMPNDHHRTQSAANLSFQGTDDEADALEREFDDVAATNAAAAASRAEKAEAERIRGAAAGRQKRLWDRALELRIRAQRAVSAAHRLPSPQAYEAATLASEPLTAAFSAAKDAAAALVGELIDLHSALIDQNPDIAEAAAAVTATSDRTAGSPHHSAGHGESQAAAQMWARIEEATARWAPYRDASLDRWHRRAALSGGAAGAKPGLKALSQPLSVQVAAAVAAPGQAQRLPLLRSNAQPVLCDWSSLGGSNADASGSDDSGAEEVAVVRANGKRGAEGDRVAHTYDDADLYDLLLKAYLDSAAPGAGVALQRQAKRRKVVDRRASKGRKLRYHVHEKLVGFMTPAQQSSHVEGLGPALFCNLFGQRKAAPVS